MGPRSRWFVGLLLMWATTGGRGADPRPAPAPSPAPLPASHQRMVALLAESAARLRRDHPLWSESQLADLRRRIAELGPNATPDRSLPLHLQLGELELRQNRIAEALPLFEHVQRETASLLEAGLTDPDTAAFASYRLGVAALRLGETQNCCSGSAPESCLAPLRGRAIHTRREGSERAVAAFTRALELTPENSELHLKAQWLLTIAYMTLGGYPDAVPQAYRFPASAFASPVSFPHFPNRAPDLGVDSFDPAGGAVIDDFDGDGYLDIVTSTFDPTEPLRYFRNQRDGTFRRRIAEANLEGIFGGFNVVQADYDNDGDRDLMVLRGAWLGRAGRIHSSLLRNDGGSFVDVTFDAGLEELKEPSHVAGWADYDNDGDLDVFVGGEAVAGYEPPCRLYRNNGNGTFTDVAAEAGVQNYRFAKGVSWGDYDEDGDPDLYVSNLGQSNRLYRNNGNGTFTDLAAELGVEGPRMSFPCWFWDVDNDGHLDLYVSWYDWSGGNIAEVARSALGRSDGTSRPALFLGDGTGRFRDVASERGLTEAVLPMGANFADLDGDGWLDFYLGTGYPDYEALLPNRMFRNDAGRRFVDVTFAGGFGHLQKGHGIAFGDLDNDGDLDVLSQMGGMFPGDAFADSLYENPGFGHGWIAVEVQGRRSNRCGIGVRLRVDVVEGSARRSIWRWVGSGGSFGANPLRQSIGLGRAERVERLEVHWPTSGTTQTFTRVPRDRVLRVVEGEERLAVVELKRLTLGGRGQRPAGR